MILSNQVNTGKQQVVNNLEISVVSLFEHENIDHRLLLLSSGTKITMPCMGYGKCIIYSEETWHML